MPRNPDIDIPFEEPEERRDTETPKKTPKKFIDLSALADQLRVTPKDARRIEPITKQSRFELTDPKDHIIRLEENSPIHLTQGDITPRRVPEDLPFTGMTIEDQYRDAQRDELPMDGPEFWRGLADRTAQPERDITTDVQGFIDNRIRGIADPRENLIIEIPRAPEQLIDPERISSDDVTLDFTLPYDEIDPMFDLGITEGKREPVQAPYDADITPDEAFGDEYWGSVASYGKVTPDAMQRLSDYQRAQDEQADETVDLRPRTERAEDIIRRIIQQDVDPTENDQ